MDIKIYTAILLTARIVSLILMVFVLRRQLQLFKYPIDEEIRRYRVILFVLALAIFAGSIVPATIDLLTIFKLLERSAQTVNGVSLLYTLTWTVTSLLSATLISWLYRMGCSVDKTHDESEHVLTNDDYTQK